MRKINHSDARFVTIVVFKKVLCVYLFPRNILPCAALFHSSKQYYDSHVRLFIFGKILCPVRLFHCDYQKVQSIMNRHVASVYEKKKPFLCEICDYHCSRKDAMKRHLVSVHEEKKPFKCELCNYRCSRKEHLKFHVQVVHEKKETIQV